MFGILVIGKSTKSVENWTISVDLSRSFDISGSRFMFLSFIMRSLVINSFLMVFCSHVGLMVASIMLTYLFDMLVSLFKLLAREINL